VQKNEQAEFGKAARLSSAVKIDDQFIWKYDVKTDDRFEQIEDKLSLERALLSLEENERELIDAIYFQQKTWAEYAQEKLVNVEWVYLMHRRILKKLRNWLKS